MLAVLGLAVVILVVVWSQRKKTARSEVNRLIRQGGLPADPDLAEAAIGWFQRRVGVLSIGYLLGILVGGVVLLFSGQAFQFGPDSEGGSGLGPIVWAFAAASFIGGGATLLDAYRAVRRSKVDGPRTATLRPRRLGDYLTPVETAIHYGVVAIPLVCIGLGVGVLSSDNRPARGWLLVASGSVAVLLWGAGIALERMALRVSQSSGRPAQLLWQEAYRAATLRDLGTAIITVSWLLGASVPSSFDWRGHPMYFWDVAFGVFLVSMVLMLVNSWIPMTPWALRRVRRVVG
ncbi:hypothetical protein GCM10029976_096430 [Kribbella albertanoniae]|uniref:Uncharacterized protein n=1 Tax=Kribbella albertanoniae TaxID=1266829 RepID=A0A4R4QFL8_9ACTN|nr:hypothetical protein [Kribbella albertanoniae]TDC34347.1 hypothetical protein E1261_04115 [Kribbella albertanoniae]